MRKMLRTAVAVTLVVCIVMMSTVSYAYDTTSWAQEFSILNRGDRGIQVRAAQRLLQQYYFTELDDSFVDGVFGEDTQYYVERYQYDNGLTVDGGIGPETWGSMQSEISIANFGNDISPYYVAHRRVFGVERSYSYETFEREYSYTQGTIRIKTEVYYKLHHEDNAWHLCGSPNATLTLLIND